MTDVINVGTTADDGTGDALRQAFIFINQRFAQTDGLQLVNARYIGALASNPATRYDGTALQTGDYYVNTGSNRFRVYITAAWVEVEDVDARAAAQAAAESALLAEAARDAAFLNADVYASTAAGIAAVSEGEQFQVSSADGLTMLRYRRDAGPVATLVASYPAGADYIVAKHLSSAHGLMFDFPNAWTDTRFLKIAAISNTLTDATGTYTKSATTSISATTANGRPALSFLSGAPSDNLSWQQSLSAIGGTVGGTISASLQILAGTVASSGARVLLQQFNGGSEISASRQTLSLPAGGVVPQIAVFAGVTVAATCTHVRLYIDSANTGTTLVTGDWLVAAGSNAQYRASPAAYVSALASTAATTAAAAAVAPTAASLSLVSARTSGVTQMYTEPNLFSDVDFSSFLSATAGGYTGPGGEVFLKTTTSTLTTTTVSDGRLALVQTATGSSASASCRISIASLGVTAGDKVSACLRLVGGSTGTSGARVMLRQINSSAGEITAVRQLYAVGNSVAVIPVTAVQFSDITIDAACAFVDLYTDIANSGNSLQTVDWMICKGSVADYRPYVPAMPTILPRRVFISPSGSDSTGAGTSASPYLTIDKAVAAIDGDGTVYISGGDYAPQRITPALVTGAVSVVGVRSSLSAGAYTYPRIILSSKLTGITKTSGATKVYQATVSGLPTMTNFQWAYQHGVADPRTVIASTDRSPQHRGRANRLDQCAKIVKTTATTLGAALVEMDASSLPLAFIDGGILYFTIVGGGDGSAADIYLDASVGFVNAASRGSAGILNITGLQVLYGGVDLRPFIRSHLDEFVAIGSRLNVIDYNVLSYGTLETACGGSQSELTGDGLNGHNGARITSGADLYSHDNWDDGFSDHEGCASRIQGGLVEYNGGTGLAPAYGSDHVGSNFVSRRNQQRGTYKPGAFAVIGAPASGSPPESGSDTLAVWINCTDIESLTSFHDTKTSYVQASWAIGCKSIRPATIGFSNSKATDCGYLASGTSTAKHASTVVENTALVV